MEKSTSIKNIAQALSEFHKRIGKIKKEANNPFFKSKYASLSNILDNIDTPLSESNLVVTQFPTANNGLTTILIHTESGEYMQDTYDMHPVKNDPQSIGSAITYARRYALGAILSLNIDDDDDGNAASQTGKATSTIAKTSQVNKGDSIIDEKTMQSWEDAVSAIGTLEGLTAYYNKNKAQCDQYSQIKMVFTKRRKQLEQQKATA